MEWAHGVTSASATNGLSGHCGPEAGSSFWQRRNLEEGLSVLHIEQ